MDSEIEAMLEQEFPLEEDKEDVENEDTEDTATERLEMEIEERFVTDENNLGTLTVQRNTNLLRWLTSQIVIWLSHPYFFKFRTSSMLVIELFS